MQTQDTIQTGAILDIPLNRLKASPNNARKAKHTGAAIEALAASIAAKGVLQTPVVEPETDEAGAPTGSYLVTIGEGRRQALLLLAKRKAIRKTHPVRCVVDVQNDAHEISLDENVTRSDMHPADQFEAFNRLAVERGYGPEEIAARFGVTAAVVRQRLKLAAVNSALVEAYRDELMTLDQLTAFAVTDDHARQAAVWEGLGWNKSPSAIRRALTETLIPASDRRVRLIGVEAYLAAGGQVVRDLFTEDDGGWLADPVLLDRMVAERLTEAAGHVQAQEGWKWAEPLDRVSGQGLRRVYPRAVERSEADRAQIEAISEEYDALVETWQHEAELPPEVEARFKDLDAALAAFGDGEVYDPDDVARGGVFVMLEADGQLRFERGFIRPDDEPEPELAEGEDGTAEEVQLPISGEGGETQDEPEGEGLSPLSDRLAADLSAHRTAGLRDTLADHPDVALLALIHALTLRSFYRGHDLGSCLDVEIKSAGLAGHAPGIDEGVACRSIGGRHAAWAGRLPKEAREVWAALLGFSVDERLALLAHCVSLSANALRTWERRPNALTHADVLAQAVSLDMRSYWTPTVASYFGRVPKARILEAVREGHSSEAAERMAGLKKGPMCEVAEETLADKGWLPSILRAPELEASPAEAEASAEAGSEAGQIAAE